MLSTDPLNCRSLFRLVSILVISVLSSICFSYEWEFEVLDNGKIFSGMSSRFLQLDGDGHPHVAYGGDHLYHAWFDGSSWQYEWVDHSIEVGGDAALALDSSGFCHISYYDDANQDLKYAHQDISGWHVEAVESDGEVGRCTSIALDASAHPHICYNTGAPEDLHYAYKDELGWHVETVDIDVGIGDKSIALDASGFPHISFYDQSCQDLKYAYKDGSGWHIAIVDTSLGCYGGASSLAIDPIGHPHISYRDYARSSLRYAYYDGSQWHIQTVDLHGNTGISNSIALNSSGAPIIGYYHQDSAIKCASLDEAGWHVQVVDSLGTGPVSLALDATGAPNVSYMTDSGDLRYARKTESEWDIQTVDSQGDVGGDTSIAIDSSQFPHISYFDLSRKDLKYTYQDELGWHIQRVDSAGDVGACTSLALDSNGFPHISYCEATNNDLKYAFCDSWGWHIEIVDSSLDGVSNTSLALDQSNDPHIGYRGSSGLKYAHRNAGWWHIEVVDQGGDMLGRTLALDSFDRPHASYVDCSGPEGELKYAFKEAFEWRIETVDAGDFGHCSLALTESGSPRIFYHNWGYSGMLYAYLENSEWYIDDVAPVWSSGSNSLALDAIGNPHITYQSSTVRGSSLVYAFRDNSGWHIETIESRGSGSDLGDGNGIAIDQFGYSHVSYHDGNYSDLRYAIGRPLHIVLSGEVIGDQLMLEWSPIPAADGFEVCGASNLPHFVPHLWMTDLYVLDELSSDITTWSSPNGVGDPNENWTYLVLAVNWCGQEIARSNRVGEQDFDTSFGP